jgi:hypothetical protein
MKVSYEIPFSELTDEQIAFLRENPEESKAHIKRQFELAMEDHIRRDMKLWEYEFLFGTNPTDITFDEYLELDPKQVANRIVQITAKHAIEDVLLAIKPAAPIPAMIIEKPQREQARARPPKWAERNQSRKQQSMKSRCR